MMISALPARFLPSRLRFKRLTIAIFVAIITILGSSLLLASHAATPAISLEAEQGTLSSDVAVVPDATSSGGQAVKFGVTSASSITVVRPAAVSLLTALLNDATTNQTVASDQTYWSNGVFYVDGTNTTGDIPWVPYQANPAVSAAMDYAYGDHKPLWSSIATTSINTEINTYLAADGSVTGPAGDPNVGAIDTVWFGSQLGQAYQALAPTLDAATKTKWQNAMKSIGNFLICHEVPLVTTQPNPYASADPSAGCHGTGETSETHFYANGNINLEYVDELDATYIITGDTRYQQATDAAYNFLIDPASYNPTEWAGYGLVITKQPTKADGSDGDGYLTEAGARDANGTLLVGYDPDYAHLQNQVIARMYLQTRDPRFLRLLNLMTNKLLKSTDTSATGANSWTIDMRCGTRHNYDTTKCLGPNEVNPIYNQCPAPADDPNDCWQVNGPFMSPSLSVLAWYGGRTDLDAYIPEDLKRITSTMDSVFVAGHTPAPGEYRWMSSSVGVLVEASDQ